MQFPGTKSGAASLLTIKTIAMSNKRSKTGYTPSGFKIDRNGCPRDGRGVNALLSSYSSKKSKRK